MRFAIGSRRLAAARMSLPLQWREWAAPLMRYGVRFIDIGHMGRSRRQKYRDGDEEGRASKREPLASAPALGERCHRSLARRLVAKEWRSAPVFVRCPHPRAMFWRGRRQKNTAHHDAIGHHVVAVTPSPEAAQSHCTLEDQCLHGLSDQTRRATQGRLKPPEWQQAQSQQETSRSSPKSDRPLNSAQSLNLAVAALVLNPRSRQRLQCCLLRRLIAAGWPATFMTVGRPHPLPHL